MQKPTHVLELNGRRYDALTGRLLDSPAVRSIDGVLPTHQVTTPQKSTSAAPAVVRPTAATVQHPSGPVRSMDIKRLPAQPTKRHPVQPSRTLMRQAVHHPASGFKRHAHAVSHTSTLVNKVHFDIVPKHSALVVDEARLHRARKIARSGLVRRFAAHTPAPASRPVAQAVSQPQVRITPPAQPVARHDDIFERALAVASTGHHEAPAAKKRTSRAHRLRQVTSVVASSLAIVLILGFVAYQNAASIQLHLASSRAGINATLPAWQPTGFHLGTFAYGPGTVTVKYENPASGQHFSIVQTASNWNSSSLLSDYIYPNNNSYDTIQSNGTTIYTYGNHNATWVNGGIWYRLINEGTLSPDQIVNIATSM